MVNPAYNGYNALQETSHSQYTMSYHYSRRLNAPFDEVVARLTENLIQSGFTVVNCIDVRETLKEKFNIDFRKYKILAAFNPHAAYKAISLESHAGLLFPCHIVVQQHENGEVEVSAISSLESFRAYAINGLIHELATDVDNRLRTAVDDLHRVAPAPGHAEALPTEQAYHNPSPYPGHKP